LQRQAGRRRRRLSAAALLFLAALVAACIGNGDRPSRTNLPRAPKTHRASAEDCTRVRGHAEPTLTAELTELACTRNADCASGRNGRCVVEGSRTHCTFDACVSSIDCAGVAVCECGPSENTCVASGCRIDQDCGKGGYCSPSPGSCGTKNELASLASTNGYPHYCHTIDDGCLDDADCKGADYCRYESSSRTWRCASTPCR